MTSAVAGSHCEQKKQPQSTAAVRYYRRFPDSPQGQRPGTTLPDYRLSDFDYALPPELIAQTPAAERSASRLLVVNHGTFADRMFRELPSLLDPRDLLVFNDTRVIRARLFGRKESGGKQKSLIERVLGPRDALAQMRASHAPQTGSGVSIGSFRLVVMERDDRFFHVRLDGDATLDDLLERHGEIPLPPYIARPATADDAARYQTVYARAPGAVAAPTAGLHFDPPMLAALAERTDRFGIRDPACGRRDVHAGADRGLARSSDASRMVRSARRDGGRHRADTGTWRPRGRGGHHDAARAGVRSDRRQVGGR